MKISYENLAQEQVREIVGSLSSLFDVQQISGIVSAIDIALSPKTRSKKADAPAPVAQAAEPAAAQKTKQEK